MILCAVFITFVNTFLGFGRVLGVVTPFLSYICMVVSAGCITFTIKYKLFVILAIAVLMQNI